MNYQFLFSKFFFCVANTKLSKKVNFKNIAVIGSWVYSFNVCGQSPCFFPLGNIVSLKPIIRFSQ